MAEPMTHVQLQLLLYRAPRLLLRHPTSGWIGLEETTAMAYTSLWTIDVHGRRPTVHMGGPYPGPAPRPKAMDQVRIEMLGPEGGARPEITLVTPASSEAVLTVEAMALRDWWTVTVHPR